MNTTSNNQAADPDKETSVWIIEDTKQYRTLLAEMLNTEPGMNCEHAFGSVEEAMPVFSTGKCPDVAMIDIQLPGTNGIEAIKQLKLMHPGLHTIVLTVSDLKNTVFEAICAGASGYLLKNDPFDEILDGIRLVLKGGSPLSAPIANMVLNTFKHVPAATKSEELSEREIEILRLLADGMSMKEIGGNLYIARSTVDYHLRAIYQKLQVHSQAGAVGKAMRKGLIF